LNSALNIPIGKTNVTDDTPVADDMKLPYSMQLGSGTVDFSLGGTLKGHEENWSWGVQQMNMIRTGTNAEGYRPGNRFELNTWAAIKALDWLSFSGRLQGVVQGSIRGIDDELNPMMSPAANASNYGDKKIKTYLGANISFPQYSALKRIKMGVEVGLPVYENYTGIQMDENGTLLFGLRYTSL